MPHLYHDFHEINEHLKKPRITILLLWGTHFINIFSVVRSLEIETYMKSSHKLVLFYHELMIIILYKKLVPSS